MEVLNLHSRTKAFSRNTDPEKSKSAVKAAAYRAGDRLFYAAEKSTQDYTAKARGVEWSEILLPDAAPSRFYNRQTLWNEVEEAEKRKDSLLAREFEIQIPKEFTSSERINLVRDFVKSVFVEQGMIADFSIHDKQATDPNPHAHIMLTTRRTTPDGFAAKKETAWEDYRGQKGLVKGWRKEFSRRCNLLYQSKGIERVVEYRKFSELGIDKIPTIHEGKRVTHMERKGERTEVRAKNDKIRQDNLQRELDRQRQEVEQQHAPKIPSPDQPKILYDSQPQQTTSKGVSDGLLKIGKRALEITDKAMEATAKGVIEPTQEKIVEPVIERVLDPLADDVAKQFGGDPLEPKLGDLSLPEIIERLGQMRAENRDLASLQQLITGYDNKLADLQHTRNGLTITTAGKSMWIDNQIQAVERSRAQAVDSLKKEYNLDPRQIQPKVEYNQAIIEKLDELRAEIKRENEMARTQPTAELTFDQPERGKDLSYDIDF